MKLLEKNWDRILTAVVATIALIVAMVSCSRAGEANRIAGESNNISEKAHLLAENTAEWQRLFTEKEDKREREKVRQEVLDSIREGLDNGWDFNREVFRKLRNNEVMEDNYNFLRFINSFEEAEQSNVRGEIWDQDIKDHFSDELFLSCKYAEEQALIFDGHGGFKKLCQRIIGILIH